MAHGKNNVALHSMYIYLTFSEVEEGRLVHFQGSVRKWLQCSAYISYTREGMLHIGNVYECLHGTRYPKLKYSNFVMDTL